jgi:hypothetical protein
MAAASGNLVSDERARRDCLVSDHYSISAYMCDIILVCTSFVAGHAWSVTAL